MVSVSETALGTESQEQPERGLNIIRSAVFGVFFSTAVFLTVLGTLYALSSNPARYQQAYSILLFNLGIITLLGIYLIYRVWGTLFAKTLRISAPLLHRRFVLIFSLAALIPAVLVGGFSTSLISKNINDLFGNNVRTTLRTADLFLNEYVTQQWLDLRNELEPVKRYLETNRQYFDNRISFTTYAHRYLQSTQVDTALIIDNQGQVYLNIGRNALMDIEIPTKNVLEFIERDGEIAFLKQTENDIIMAVTRLESYENLYLLGLRYLSDDASLSAAVATGETPSSGVLSSISGIDEAEQALAKYDSDQARFQRTFFLTLLETALLVLYLAVVLGFVLANRIIGPLGHMVETAERIRGGDLSARVNVKGDWGEMSDLGSALNRMTVQLGSQREDLVREHNLSERRRLFSEAVLSGVTAGVIGLSQEGRITLMNASAEKMLECDAKDILGFPIDQVFPEFAGIFKRARENVFGRAEDQINLETDSGIRNFDLRASSYEVDVNDTGWVITFDDMTRLVAAQRYSAWREVARRIAHEIKNPLTPILLSAERLKRKYTGQISGDKSVFENCTDTIIRQVGTLEQMVNEFSSFARMPEPDFSDHNLMDILEHVAFAQGVAFPDVKFQIFNKDKKEHIPVSCDIHLMSQALTNVLKNAAESISERLDQSGLDHSDGLVSISVQVDDGLIGLDISDNGKGWPLPDRDRLLEPYVTTRDSGTGLGLAIVKRIIEDHKGSVELSERPDGQSGAHIRIILPLLSENAANHKDLNQQEISHEA